MPLSLKRLFLLVHQPTEATVLITIHGLLFGQTDGEDSAALQARFRQLTASFSGAPTLAPDLNQYVSRADLGRALQAVETPNAKVRAPHENELARVYSRVTKRGIVGNSPLAPLLSLPAPASDALAQKLEEIAAFGLGAAIFVAQQWGLEEGGSLTTARAVGTALRHLASPDNRNLLASLPDFKLEPAVLFPLLNAQRKAALKNGDLPQALKLLTELDDKLRFNARAKHAKGRGTARVMQKKTSRKLVGGLSRFVELDAPKRVAKPSPKVRRAKSPKQIEQSDALTTSDAPLVPLPNGDTIDAVEPVIDGASETQLRAPKDPIPTDPAEGTIFIPLSRPRANNRQSIPRSETDEDGFETEIKERIGSERFYNDDEPEKQLRMPMRTIRHAGGRQQRPRDGLTSVSDPLWQTQSRTVAHNMVRREHFLPCSPDFVTFVEASAIYEILLNELKSTSQSAGVTDGIVEVLLVLILGRSRAEIAALNGQTSNQRPETWLVSDDETLFSTKLILPSKNITALDADFLLAFPSHELLLRLPMEIQQALKDIRSNPMPLFRGNDDFEIALKSATASIGRPITEAMLSRFLPAHCASLGIDKAVSGWILAERPRDRPMLSYARFPEVEAQLGHQEILVSIGSSASVHDLDKASRELGTQLVPAPESLTALFENLKLDIEEVRRQSSHDFVTLHNNFTLYVVTLLMLATGHRPVRDPFDRISSFDLEHGLCFIADKEVRGSSSARALFLPDLAQRQLLAYIQHLDRLGVEAGTDHRPLAKRAHEALNGQRTLFFFFRGHEDFAVSPASLLEEMKDVWALQPNWPRHTLRALIGQNVDPEVLDAIMGHDGDGFGHQSADSGIALSSLKKASEQINEELLGLDIEVATGLVASRNWIPRLPELLPAIKVEGRALKKLNRERVDLDIKLAVDGALIDAGLFIKLSDRKVEPNIDAVGKWDDLIGRVANGIEISNISSGKQQAYLHLEKRAQQMVDASGTDLKIPAKPFSIPTPPALYSEGTIMAAQAMGAWRAAFSDKLQAALKTKGTPAQWRALALYSAITNGFLLRSEAVVALEAQLRRGAIDFVVGPHNWLCIRLNCPVQAGACNWVEGEQGFNSITFIPDPVTAELMARALETVDPTTPATLEPIVDSRKLKKAIFSFLSGTLFLGRAEPPKTISTLDQLCAAGFIPLEASGFEISQALRAALMGKNQTFGPDPIAMAHICGFEPEAADTRTPYLSSQRKRAEGIEDHAPPNWQRYADALQRLLTLDAGFENSKSKKKAVCDELERLLAFPSDGTHARLLIEWLHELFTIRNRKYSTFRRYVSPILFLYLTEFDGVNLHDLDGDDFVEHYTNIIDQKRSPISQNYTANRLAQLHNFGVSKRTWRLAPLSEPLGDDIDGLLVTRARIVTSAALQKIQAAFSSRDTGRGKLAPALAMMALVIARSGLRRSETVRMRLRDVQVIWPGSGEGRVANPDLGPVARDSISNAH